MKNLTSRVMIIARSSLITPDAIHSNSAVMFVKALSQVSTHPGSGESSEWPWLLPEGL